MLVQCDGHAVGRCLEKIIADKDTLQAIHGWEKMDKIIKKAQRMLDLVTDHKLKRFNLQHSMVLLDTDDFHFLKTHEPSDGPITRV